MRKTLKILISEGSSLSARQTITALGRAGYVVDVCTSDRFCIGAFSRYVHKLHVVPAAAEDPKLYFDAVINLLRTEPYDVLLPTHEQAFLFAARQEEIEQYTRIALAPFSSFLQVQSKTASALLFEKIGLPQPVFEVVASPHSSLAWNTFPMYAKLAYGTAGQSVWRLNSSKELQTFLDTNGWQSPNELLLQAEAHGRLLCQAQALFSKGVLVAIHCTQQHATGIGNSQSARLSVDHPKTRVHMERLGRELRWHGPLAIDYLYDQQTGPEYIEVNPRLVEPMNAVYSGLNLAELTVRLSVDGQLSMQSHSTVGTISSSLLATILGVADRSRSRRKVLMTIYSSLLHRGAFKDSREDLTPISDPLSIVPLIVVVVRVLLRPSTARYIAASSIKQYALSSSAIEHILGWVQKG